MKFFEVIKEVKKELLKEYKEVIFQNYQPVTMTRNTTTSTYGYKKTIIDTDNIKVRHIKDRFEEITGDIEAVEITFEVKRPRQRKYRRHTEYLEVISE